MSAGPPLPGGVAAAPGGGRPIIQVADLWHTYMAGTPFEQLALRGVAIEVREGEVVGILGRTGSGKSTLIQYLNGLFRPRRGRVIVAGHDLASPRTDLRAVRRLVGLVFQDPETQMFEPLVGDDIAYGPRQLNLSMEEIRARVRWAMDAVGLPFERFKDRYTFSLSGGEMRKAALAGVLAIRPRVLVLDEPTSGLDPASRAELRRRIQDLRDRDGLTLVLVSHDMEDVARLSDRLYVLQDGRVAAEGPPREVFSDPARLAALGLVPPEPVQVVQRLRALGLDVPGDALTVEEAADAVAALLGVP